MPPVRSKLTRYLIHYYSFTEMMNTVIIQCPLLSDSVLQQDLVILVDTSSSQRTLMNTIHILREHV
ncbi:hypothetical protein RO3G_07043 [Rhizopus delemar RA 99-880]|uniref:Uncharacterized protein n=1 Tax=Rhizopus delemar (strain RA 99-880 / ATCC MYA-4621 / FGSC 9543 / NRRL 43880) TaxID=246409 RepID=I1C1K8_RHIO9|nr:hypothetical protein RO3G_07043 [Rhizopus delemar RA 99-880]|eukprot:EIE82338.1 hypothetical protein RO3G_07043 [Rhizopus delemar RA 99-880]